MYLFASYGKCLNSPEAKSGRFCLPCLQECLQPEFPICKAESDTRKQRIATHAGNDKGRKECKAAE